MRKQDIKVGEWYGYTTSTTYRDVTPLLVVALDGIIAFNSRRFGHVNVERVQRGGRSSEQVYLGVTLKHSDEDAARLVREFDLWAEGSSPPPVVLERQALVESTVKQVPTGPDSIALRSIQVPAGLRLIDFTGRQLVGPWVETHAAQVTERQRKADRRAREQLAHDARKAAFAELSTLAARVGLRLGPTQTYGEGSFLHATVRVDELTALLTELAAQRADDSI